MASLSCQAVSQRIGDVSFEVGQPSVCSTKTLRTPPAAAVQESKHPHLTDPKGLVRSGTLMLEGPDSALTIVRHVDADLEIRSPSPKGASGFTPQKLRAKLCHLERGAQVREQLQNSGLPHQTTWLDRTTYDRRHFGKRLDEAIKGLEAINPSLAGGEIRNMIYALLEQPMSSINLQRPQLDARFARANKSQSRVAVKLTDSKVSTVKDKENQAPDS